MIRAILFDLDGVLVDATEWHRVAFTDALEGFGVQITRELHDDVLNGLPTWKKLEKLRVPVELWGEIEDKKRDYFDEILEVQCKPDREKVQLLKALKAKRYRIGVCSNARTLSTYRMLERAGLLTYVDRVFGSDDVDEPKPSPEIYQKAMKELVVGAHQTVIIEDSRPGVEAAKASMATVLVTPDYQSVTREFMKDYL